MTRLAATDIANIPARMGDYNAQLHAVAGLTLPELVALALDRSAHDIRTACQGKRVGIIPLTSGEGRISGFAEALAAIAVALDCVPAILPPDEEGFALAPAYDLSLWADDHCFTARHNRLEVEAHNGEATGRGFAAVLNAMLGRKTTVVVRGCGSVGQAAGRTLARWGHHVVYCDVNPHMGAVLTHALGTPHVPLTVPSELGTLAPQVEALLDAAPTPLHLPTDLLTSDAVIAAPSMPCVWPTLLRQEQRLWHDPLQTGTAVMLAAVASALRL